jgi:16S rRNA (cytosine1402-N4)-methyltransferase
MVHEYHDPVLLQACLEGLNIRPGRRLCGRNVRRRRPQQGHPPTPRSTGRLIAFDRDRDAWNNATGGRPLHLGESSDFRWMRNHLRFLHALPVDGLLADLGVSSHQFDTGARGFSFRFDGPLDMRMDHRAKRTASQLLRDLDERRLTTVLRKYGEVDGAHRVARQLVKANAETRIGTTYPTGGSVEAGDATR